MKKPIGVLLINLGTPDAPTPSALRRYLSEFLSDPRVVEIPKLLWWPLLHGIILNFRARRSAEYYQTIWTEEGSPLLVNMKKLTEKTQKILGDDYVVAFGMRYGKPSLKEAVQTLKTKCEQWVVLPLYPQYSSAATGSAWDELARCFKQERVIPSFHFVSHYFEHPFYIEAIAQSIQEHWKKRGKKNFLLFSFHGLPKRCSQLGDSYEKQCCTTAERVADHLGLKKDEWRIVFQSRFGRAEWLQPYCDVTLRCLPKQGHKNVEVVCPGFSVDCLETLEEIAQRNKAIFLKSGGESLDYIPALNDSEGQVRLIQKLIL